MTVLLSNYAKTMGLVLQISQFFFPPVPIMELFMSPHFLVFLSRISSASFFKFPLFNISILLWMISKIFNYFSMTVHVSFLQQTSIQLDSTNFLRLSILLFIIPRLENPIGLIIQSNFECRCRQCRLTCICQPQIKLNIPIEVTDLWALKLFAPNDW